MRGLMKTFKLAVSWIAVFLLIGTASAEVIATVDRTSVELNESFILKLTVDTQIDAEPNAAGLDADFFVGSRSHLSNTTIMNGEVQRSRTWSFVMMAKREGNLIIPPISIGSEQSNPVRITVMPQSIAVPGEADIFITAEVDRAESYVQAQVLYTVKTYRSVATRQPRWSEPASSGVETLIEIAGEEKNYEALLDGKAYNVIERIYAFFPQESGELHIAPARFEARVLRDRRITGRKVFQSESLSVVVNPIPPPPADYPDAAWFPAKSVELSQEWSRELSGLPAGEPLTRHITIVAMSQLQTQIPILQPASADGIRVYPDKPELRTVAGSYGVRALRRDQYALIGTRSGEVELPAIELPWWNVDAAEWRVASLPATTLTILPSPNEQAPAQPESTASSENAGPDTPAEVVVIHSEWWRRVSAALLTVWLVTLLSWWWSRRPREQKSKEPEAPPIYKQQARCLKTARKAALSADAGAFKSALLAWGRLQWPDNSPRNLGDLAMRVSMPLSIELNSFCSARYGPDAAGWDGESMARALRSFSVLLDEDGNGVPGDLPPLLPG